MTVSGEMTLFVTVEKWTLSRIPSQGRKSCLGRGPAHAWPLRQRRSHRRRKIRRRRGRRNRAAYLEPGSLQ